MMMLRAQGAARQATAGASKQLAVASSVSMQQRSFGVKRKKAMQPLDGKDPNRKGWPRPRNQQVDISWYESEKLGRQSLKNLFAKQPAPIDNNDPAYQIMGATILERTPVCVPEMYDWEKDFEDMLAERADKISIEVPEMFKPGAMAAREGAVKNEEELAEEAMLDNYVPAARYTAEDLTDDKTTLNRRLQESLYLIVKRKGAEHWEFPYGLIKKDESIRDCAVRNYVQQCGKAMELHFLGNAPIGYQQVEFDKPSGEHKGARVFFQHAVLIKHYQDQLGIELDKKTLEDYAWVSKRELPDFISPALMSVCEDMLMDQNWITALDKLADGTLTEEEMLQDLE